MGLQKCALNLNRIGKELQPHGTAQFPCAGYSAVYTDKPEDVIPWHWHEELEIVYVETGSLKLQIPGKTFHLGQGEGFVINSNLPHYAAAENFCNLHSLVFHPVLITGSKDSVFAVRYMTPLIHCSTFDGCPLSLTDAFNRAFRALKEERPGHEFTVRENLSFICFSLHERYAHEIDLGETGLDPDSRRIQIMLEYIHQHYCENLDLTQIARSADIGNRECLRCFKRSIQNSPMQYLLKYRTTQGAALLLQDPGSSVSEIAAMCGFNSASNFSQMFKRFFKCTPREYRREHGR